jgi:hypothetical protein
MFDRYCPFPLFDVSISKICSPLKIRGFLDERENLQYSYKEHNLAGIKLQALSIALIWWINLGYKNCIQFLLYVKCTDVVVL